MAQATDMADWLPHDLMLKLDRCLMAHGVEGRTPLLDPAVTAAGFRLPDAMKVRDGQGKWLLRRWLEGAMPAARPFAPKQGFTVPIGAWIAAEGSRLGRLVAAQAGVREVAMPDRVEGLFRAAAGRREGFAAWTLLFYAIWHRAHIEGVPAGGDVFDYLGGPRMTEHYDLLIRGGTCVLPWGEAEADIGVRRGRIAAVGAGVGATADQVVEAAGLHVLPGLMDPHVHFRDPGDAAVESIPMGSKGGGAGRAGGGFRYAEHRTEHHRHEQLVWKRGYVENRRGATWGYTWARRCQTFRHWRSWRWRTGFAR